MKVRPDVGEQTITVWLLDWANSASDDFAIAEEVTVAGENTKRPDLVLYVNGIALGVLELKPSTVSVSEIIRQNLDSQKKAFIRRFCATVQLVMAGNETEGLRYGVIETPEKYWLRIKRDMLVGRLWGCVGTWSGNSFSDFRKEVGVERKGKEDEERKREKKGAFGARLRSFRLNPGATLGSCTTGDHLGLSLAVWRPVSQSTR